MKTIKTKKIDGYDIITGIGTIDGLIDPVATNKIVNTKIKLTQPYKDIEKIKKQMQVYANAALKARQSFQAAKTKDEQKKHGEDWSFRIRQMEEEQQKIMPILPKLKEKQKELIYENAVYFETTASEEIVTDEKATEIEQKLKTAMDNGNYLSKDLNEVIDERGTYWNGTEKTIIDQIGIAAPLGYIIDEFLTDEQRQEINEQLEIDRIAALTTAQKEEEKQIALNNALSQAVNMRSELEIEGDPDALQKSQDWYADQKVLIEEKYS